MENEIWKDVAGYEGLYQVSNLGRIKSLPRKRTCRVRGGGIATMTVPSKILKQWKRDRYLLVDFWKDRKRDVRSVHILVYETFVGKIEKGNVVHHIDENKFNNVPENLEQMPAGEHTRMHFLGKSSWNKGQKMNADIYKKQWETRRRNHPTETRDKNIFEDKQNGMSLKELSSKYNLCTRQILTICKQLKMKGNENVDERTTTCLGTENNQ